MKKLPTTATQEDIRKIKTEMMNMQHATCKIMQNFFTQSFQRVHKHKWLSNPGPEGLCNVVRVSTLENDPKHPILWTYTSTIASADKSELCDKWVASKQTIVSSWKTSKAYKFPQCKYLEYQ